MTADEPQLVLHLGAPKCGSSSLQGFWSHEPVSTHARLKVPGLLPYEYVTLIDGVVWRGESISRGARAHSLGYLASDAPPKLLTYSFEQLRQVKHDLGEVLTTGRIPLASCEGYLAYGSGLHQGGFFEALDLAVLGVAYVRPPVEFLNTAWWQWGAWSAVSVEEFVDRSIESTRWARQLGAWHQIPQVKRLRVRALPGDVLGDLHEGASAAPRENAALSPALLRALSVMPDLRPEHSPEIDFALRRWANSASRRPPWVLTQRQVRRVIAQTRSDVSELRDFTSPEDWSAIESDARWWTHEAYAERETEPGSRPPTYEEVLAALRVTTEALLAAHAAEARLAATHDGPD